MSERGNGSAMSGKPNGGPPNAGKPTGGKPNAGKPNGGKPNGGKPNAGPPNAGKPAGALPQRLPGAAVRRHGGGPPWMGAGMPTEKSMNFVPSARRLIGRLRPHRLPLVAIIALA